MNSIKTFIQQVSSYLSRSTSSAELRLIKFDANSHHHDFSFPIDLNKIWRYYFEIEECDGYNNSILNFAGNCEDDRKAVEKLKDSSKEWIFMIDHAWVEKEICYFNITRNRTLLDQIISDDSYYELKTSESKVTLYIKTSKSQNSFTNFRLKTIERTLRNLIKFAPHITLTEDQTKAQARLLLTTRSNLRNNEHDELQLKSILCGVVLSKNENGKQISQIEADEYIERRSKDIHLIVIHKFGVRTKDEREFSEVLKKLGRAASTLDMLEVKHSSSLTFTSNPKQVFILYNSARIETLISTFNQKVKENYYAPLPPLCDIHFEFLSEPLEWILLKNMLFLPYVIEKSLGDIKNGQIAIHLLYKYLVDFTKSFSNFYSKKKILLENRQHLMPKVYAKIYLLQAIQTALNKILEIFDIEPVKFM